MKTTQTKSVTLFKFMFVLCLILIQSVQTNAKILSPPCVIPTVPTLGASSTSNCGTVSTTLTIVSGTLNDATAWKWYSGSCGGTLAGSGTSLTVAPSVTTTYFARGEGGCVVAGSCASITITVNPIPTVSVSPQPQVICNGGSTGLSLSSNIAGSTFTWGTSPISGTVIGNDPCTLGCGTNLANILYNVASATGSVGYAVTATSPAGCVSAVSNAVVSVYSIPATPPVIFGPNAVCGLTSATYSIAPVPGATAYFWTLPTGPIQMNMLTGQGTTQITCSVPAGTLAVGDVTITASNTCGTSVPQAMAIVKKPLTPGAISGPTTICGSTSATWSIAPVFGATSYTWTIPTGMTVVSGLGTTQISVSVASTFVNGLVKVSAVNACGSVPGAAINVTGNPPITPLYMYGSTNVCALTTTTYSCSAVVGATSYVWNTPPCMTITSGQGTALINVNINPALVIAGQQVTVKSSNICGYSAVKTLTLINTIGTPLSITGPANTCGLSTATYTTPVLAGAVSYNWAPATGQTIISGQSTTELIVSIAPPVLTTTATSTLKVTATNGCGFVGGFRQLIITRCLSAQEFNNGVGGEEDASFNIYPNPATDQLTIDNGQWTSDNGQLTIEIYNVVGERVLQSTITNNQSTIDINQLSKGLYFVRLVSDGNTVYSQTVIKQ